MTNTFLIINPYGIGDVFFSTPLITSIKAHNPQAHIYYLCNQRTYDIVKDLPDVAQVFVYERDAFIRRNAPSFLAWLKKWHCFIRDIRREHIDAAIDLSLNTGIGAIAFFAGIRKRVGLNYKGRGRFLTQKIAIDGFDDKHAAEYYLKVLEPLGIPKVREGLTIGLNKEAVKWAKDFLEKNAILSQECVVAIAPCGGETLGPRAKIKRWPEENFSHIINALHAEYGCKVFLFGGPKDQDVIDQILAGVDRPERCFALTQTSLVQCAALVNRCDLFIGNDTGVLRFADALKKKIIAFFGPTDEKVYGLFPYDESRHAYMFADIECRPCYQRFRLKECERDRACLRNVTVDDVMAKVARLLSLVRREGVS